MKKPKPCITVMEHSGHLRTLEKCRKHSPAARVFYISLVFSNHHRGRPSPPKDRHVRRTFHWPSRERGSKEAIQGQTKSLTTCNIDHRQWSDLAADPVAWRHTIHQAAAQFEVNRKNSIKDMRQRRKACAASTTTPDILFPAVTAHGPVSLVSVWSVMGAPAVDVNLDKLLKSSFAKPSHDDRSSMNTRLRLLYLLNRKWNENASVEKIKNEQIIFLCLIKLDSSNRKIYLHYCLW